MFERLVRFFQSPPPEPDPLPEPDARLALGALLVRVAQSDLDYRAEEIGVIDRILAERLGLGPIDAAKMRATCEKLEKAAPRTDAFEQLIRDTVPYDERLAIVQAMWRVVLADGTEADEEQSVVHLAEHRLGVAPEDSAAAHEAARRA